LNYLLFEVILFYHRSRWVDVLVVALYRRGELIVPHGNTRIEAGDRLTLMGSLEHIETARPIFEQF
jgi:Trk K+ transport system NAD-binding subunit